jgi:hypothetical protein
MFQFYSMIYNLDILARHVWIHALYLHTSFLGKLTKRITNDVIFIFTGFRLYSLHHRQL